MGLPVGATASAPAEDAAGEGATALDDINSECEEKKKWLYLFSILTNK